MNQWSYRNSCSNVQEFNKNAFLTEIQNIQENNPKNHIFKFVVPTKTNNETEYS